MYSNNNSDQASDSLDSPLPKSPIKKAQIIKKEKVYSLFENDEIKEEELIERSHFFRRILQISY